MSDEDYSGILDKDKLIEFLEWECSYHMDECDGEYAYQKYLLLQYTQRLKKMIEEGAFDVR